MARMPRLLDLFQQAVSDPRRPAPSLADIFTSGSASGRFRSRLDRAELRRLWETAAGAGEAEARGMRLLKENLTSTQRIQYDKRGFFEVTGGATGRRYRIRNGTQMNVELLDKKGRAVRVLCFMPRGELVAGDIMLAQKLALELFELDALKVANKFSPDFAPFGPVP
jgi:hypothetical protein